MIDVIFEIVFLYYFMFLLWFIFAVYPLLTFLIDYNLFFPFIFTADMNTDVPIFPSFGRLHPASAPLPSGCPHTPVCVYECVLWLIPLPS